MRGDDDRVGSRDETRPSERIARIRGRIAGKIIDFTAKFLSVKFPSVLKDNRQSQSIHYFLVSMNWIDVQVIIF